MNRDALNALCWASGITTHYGDREIPDHTKETLLAALGVTPETGPEAAGVPDFHASPAPTDVCHLPNWLTDAPAWGVFCQLYELRSARNWGIGDFTDLTTLVRTAAAEGADFIGINPLHALFLAAPNRHSPFTPSNRQFLNPLYIAMDDLPGNTRPDAKALAELRAAELVDYEAVAALKLKGLQSVFARKPFDARYTEDDFFAFCTAGGESLARHALFEALSLTLAAKGHGAGWHGWPEAWQNPESKEVRRFAERSARKVRFQLWLQWIAARQLDAAKQAARSAGMRIGLYLDLAVGEAPDGSATWASPGLTLRGAVVGAPPDVFSDEGQNWNLSAMSPTALAAADFAPFRALLTAQQDYAGALRIDHVMLLRQLFMIPEGQPATAGTHVAWPLADMLRVLSEESRRHGTVTIGEDLGWVPDGFRDQLQAANVLTCRILYFETDWGLFKRASTYPQKALACISTHDLPTLHGWWTCEDIEAREKYGLITPQYATEQKALRAEERVALVNAFKDGGELPADAADWESEALPPRVLGAAYRFLARTPSVLVGVRLADLVGPTAQTNVPGTMDEHPNWRRRAPVDVGDIAGHDAFRGVASIMRAERPRA